MSVVDFPGALCTGIPEVFELIGKDASGIRRAAYTCTLCPMLERCGREARGTAGMIRAGRVYAHTGISYHPELYIRQMRRWNGRSARAGVSQ